MRSQHNSKVKLTIYSGFIVVIKEVKPTAFELQIQVGFI